MMGLSEGERILMMRSAVLIQLHACDRQTDGRTDRQTELAWNIRAIAYMLSRVKMNYFDTVCSRVVRLGS